MPWVTLPVAPDALILAAHFDEVRLAINERYNAAGLADPALADVWTNGDQPLVILTSYRTAIDNIIPYYANPALSYAAYTKAACLTAAIGAANWIPAPPGDLTMYAGQINDMRLALNLLLWVRLEATLVADEQINDDTAGLFGGTWNQAWTQAKNEFGAAWWVPYVGGSSVGGFFTAYQPFPPWVRGYRWTPTIRWSDVTFNVANFPVVASKLRFTALGTPYRFRVFEAADFMAFPIPVNADGWVDLAATAQNALNHLSVDVDMSVLDDFRPADVSGAYKGCYTAFPDWWVIVVHHTFSYQ